MCGGETGFGDTRFERMGCWNQADPESGYDYGEGAERLCCLRVS